VARVLIVGCGCRGRLLGRLLAADGHAVRGTSRGHAGTLDIAAAGLEPWLGDPDRIASLTAALDAVTILCWLLGSARGDAASLAALHASRLERMLEEAVDTTVRGVVYEAAGSVHAGVLARGGELVGEASARWSIPTATIDHDPADHAGWLRAGKGAVDGLLGARGRYTRRRNT